MALLILIALLIVQGSMTLRYLLIVDGFVTFLLLGVSNNELCEVWLPRYLYNGSVSSVHELLGGKLFPCNRITVFGRLDVDVWMDALAARVSQR